MIQVDSRRAGAGKTTEIYTQIDRLLRKGQRVLLVVPSIELQECYRKQFPNAIYVINSRESSELVSLELRRALYAEEQFICITSNAWLNNPIDPDRRSEYHLIMDEIINPYEERFVQLSDKKNVQLISLLNSAFEIDPTTAGDQWARLLPSNDRTYTDTNILDRTLFRDLYNPNYELWVDNASWSRCLSGQLPCIYIFRSLRTQAISGWLSVYIAAAAFQRTFMYAWLRANGIMPSIVKPFRRHLQIPWIWTPDDIKFHWTKGKQEDDGYLKSYYQQVHNILDGESALLLRNNTDRIIPGFVYEPVSHNAHGINNLAGNTNICIASATNPTPQMARFLRREVERAQITDDYGKHMDYEAVTSWIFEAFAVYNHYQIIMRTALRNPNNTTPVRVFVYDYRVFAGLLAYFDITQWNKIDVYQPKNRIPMTNAERQRKFRLKKKSEPT